MSTAYEKVCEVIDEVKLDDRAEDTDVYASRIMHAVGDSGAMPTIAFSDDAIDSAIYVLRSLRLYVVDLEIPENTGYPDERVCIVRIDPDSDVVVCETEDDGSPISNATWAVPINLIKKVTVL